jgi:KipI family sensor histidine kinase inhibitor
MAPVGQYLRYSTVFDEQANLRVLALAAALASTKPDGVREIYPGYGSVYVEWDDAQLSNDQANAWIDHALEAPDEALRDPAEITVPVRYGGLDTDDVAEATGLDPEQIATLHAEIEYRVCARATVGQPMMGVTDERLRVPRRPNPRTDVPALAVAIANEQATIYPALMPGGWNVIGTALVNVYDPHRDEPFAFGLGDRVRFEERAGDAPEPPQRRPLLPAEPRHPALRVEEPGALDILVDGGRLNQSHHGMAQAGPLDARVADLANRLAGNLPGTTLIESTLSGPTFLAIRDLVVGAAGRGLQLYVDDEPAGQVTTHVRKGQRVALRPTGVGVRGYLALAGGIEADPFLGSTSVDRIGLIGSPLKRGDILGLARDDAAPHELQARAQEVPYHLVLRLRRGPQWSREAEEALTSDAFTVGKGDRMGVRLEGPDVPGGELLSESPPPGAVQVPNGGAPILLLADRQRSAGYDKPAVIHPDDLPLAGQLQPGERLRFVFVGDHPVPWFRDLE